MAILYLGRPSPIVPWLVAQGETLTCTESPLTVASATGYDWLLSYNSRYIVPTNVLALFPPTRRLNLHISYLPWNRGADPNFWSWMDHTVKGVTIHSMDAGVDTGPWLVRQEVDLPETHTLRTSYATLHDVMQQVFKESWPQIKAEQFSVHPQETGGSVHRKAEVDPYRPYLTSIGYDLPITEVQRWMRETRGAYA